VTPQFFGQPRLADARFAGNEHELAAAAARVVEPRAKQIELAVPPHEGPVDVHVSSR
jgi:hypothetical protein